MPLEMIAGLDRILGMSQPVWALVFSTDTDALFNDTTGEYPAEVEHVEELYSEDGEDPVFYLYRTPLDRCKVVTGEVSGKAYLVPYRYDAATYPHPLPQYEEWFAKDLGRVAESVGSTREELVSALCSEDAKERLFAYDAIAGYHGWIEFDHDPMRLTEDELSARWK